jgi:type II secretory ATPase GspE/PulE/Tfp pilus assembly ATPase PilB-like protein
VVSPEQLEQAIEQQTRMPLVRIGEALVAMGFITQAQLDEALQQQRENRDMPLGELLVHKGLVSREHLQLALSRKMGYPMVDVRRFPVEPEALAKVPFAIAHRHGALPLMLRGGRLVLALDDPSRRQVIDEVEFVSQCSVVPVLARVLDIPGAIDRAYDRLGLSAWEPSDGLKSDPAPEADQRDANELLATLELEQKSGPGQRREADEPVIEQSDNSLVKLINQMILEAQAQRVSDIHVECQPGRDKVRIRFRKDGRLRPYLELPHTYRAAVIARLKIMCDLDISERRKPQDGKINFGRFQPGSKLELRLATIPTHGGLEDAVLRLLTSAKPLPLDKLQLSPDNLATLKDLMERPYGMLLCVGPTGSGKTTTLHSAMGYINTPERKIWTAEDPIEISQPGLRQVQVHAKIDWTFAKALRAFLRADPDVVMVGEIRDAETAQVAVEASLTGHLVLSTLHTNSSAETVTRLLDMGMDPFNFSDSLLGVLAQRLVRRLCTQCRTTREATGEEIDEWLGDHLHAFVDDAQRPARDAVLAEWTARHAKDGRLCFHHSPGCQACDHTGFSGRVAIHELMRMSRPLRQLIQTGARAEQILRAAMAEGLRTLRQDGIDKVLAGLTSIEEVRASSNV